MKILYCGIIRIKQGKVRRNDVELTLCKKPKHCAQNNAESEKKKKVL
jgi:hypothetical protein